MVKNVKQTESELPPAAYDHALVVSDAFGVVYNAIADDSISAREMYSLYDAVGRCLLRLPNLSDDWRKAFCARSRAVIIGLKVVNLPDDV